MRLSVLLGVLSCWLAVDSDAESPWRDVPLTFETSDMVRPWTGLVLWHDAENPATDAISMEYSYIGYADCVSDDGQWEWSEVERRLDQAASRSHQSILRFYYVYPGKAAAVPKLLRDDGFKGQWAPSEGKRTEFIDWSNESIKRWTLAFHREFGKRYDNDPRLAAMQTGFGLWGEYHIYDGPRKLGDTFPDKRYQREFLETLDASYAMTPHMVSINVGDDEYSPVADEESLLSLRFSLFDDSFLAKAHSRWNAPKWEYLTSAGPTRYHGGELNYYTKRDQKLALAPDGPHGESFNDAARRFGISFMIANDQPRYRSLERIKQASLATGYRLAITTRQTNGNATRLTIRNIGVAPPAHPIAVRMGNSVPVPLQPLPAGQSQTIDLSTTEGEIMFISDRLISGQRIPHDVLPQR